MTYYGLIPSTTFGAKECGDPMSWKWRLRPSGGRDSAVSQPEALGEPGPGVGCPVSPAGPWLVIFTSVVVDSIFWVTLVSRAKKYGPVVRVNVFHKTSVIVTSPESVKVGSSGIFTRRALPSPRQGGGVGGGEAGYLAPGGIVGKMFKPHAFGLVFWEWHLFKHQLFGDSDEQGCLMWAVGTDFTYGLIWVGSLVQLVHMCSPLSPSAFICKVGL